MTKLSQLLLVRGKQKGRIPNPTPEPNDPPIPLSPAHTLANPRIYLPRKQPPVSEPLKGCAPTRPPRKANKIHKDS